MKLDMNYSRDFLNITLLILGHSIYFEYTMYFLKLIYNIDYT